MLSNARAKMTSGLAIIGGSALLTRIFIHDIAEQRCGDFVFVLEKTFNGKVIFEDKVEMNLRIELPH